MQTKRWNYVLIMNRLAFQHLRGALWHEGKRIRVYCQTVMASVWFWWHLFPVYSPGCRRFYQAIIILFSMCILFQLYIWWAIVHWFHALEVFKFIQLYWLHTFYLCQVSMVIITPSKCNSVALYGLLTLSHSSARHSFAYNEYMGKMIFPSSSIWWKIFFLEK